VWCVVCLLMTLLIDSSDHGIVGSAVSLITYQCLYVRVSLLSVWIGRFNRLTSSLDAQGPEEGFRQARTTTKGRSAWERYWNPLRSSREERDLYKQVEDLNLSELESLVCHPGAVPTYYSRLSVVVSALKEKEDLLISTSETVKDALCKRVEHMDERRTLRRMLHARRWRGERLTLSDFLDQMTRLVLALEMVVLKNAGHYRVAPRELFRAWGRPGAWNSDEEVRARLVILAKAKVEKSDEFLFDGVDGHNPASPIARTNKVRKRRVRSKKVLVGQGRVPRESGHRTLGWDEPEAEQREVAATTTVVSPGEYHQVRQ